MPDQDYSEHRSFERYPIDFDAEIGGVSPAGDAFVDKSVLRNISGGGVCLLTDYPAYYALGQEVHLRIRLPDTDRLAAYMVCSATVAWVHTAEATESEGRVVFIGLSLNDPFTFESHKFSATDDIKESGL
ncbi:PilZ domain-containing protein [Mariprofundus sp. KV]|uniref:PilZ domain-containing protein n=1 Tax=Mariprofundus sp. KV TaxID=2608715 RepID=UPI0015A0352B|nr:PilZ domain-containing protein [Mariprofundus sp. KV]NWF35642.1 PilZ domain-containing protein [Mariprofundus sp. KV]